MEDRFSADQESVEKRFQADILKLEQHYQSELKALSESHKEQKLHWEAQIQEALKDVEEQRRAMEETMEQEREQQDQQRKTEMHELENLHEEKVKELLTTNQQLQAEVDDLVSKAQTKEIELSRQLNDLHVRLQESLETRDELLAQIEKKALDTELLLNQTVEDFKLERAELLTSQTEQEEKIKQMQSISEKQISERIELLTERDDLKVKIEELEMLLQQAAVDFEVEQKELKEYVSFLEKSRTDDLGSDKAELIAEREMLKNRIKELELESSQRLTSVEKPEEVEEEVKTLEKEIERCCEPPEIISLQRDPSNREPFCLLPSLVEEVETAVEAALYMDVDGESENVTQIDYKLPENVNMTDAAEGEEHNQISATEDDAATLPKSLLGIEGDPEGGSCSAVYCGGCNPDSPLPAEKNSNAEAKSEAVSPQLWREEASIPEALEGVDEGGENEGALESCEEGRKPQDVPDLDNDDTPHEKEPCHETEADSSVLEEVGDLTEPEVGSCEHQQNAEHSDFDSLTSEIKDESAHEYLETLPEDADCEDEGCSFPNLQVLYNIATEENFLLHEKISLLQQKTKILDNLLAHNNEKVQTGHQVLEENYSLKVKILLLMERVRELEMKTFRMADLQIRYEDCMCENAKLKVQNSELERRVWNLEGSMSIFREFQNPSKVSLADEIVRMREENSRLSELLVELDRQREILSAGQPACPAAEPLLDLTDHLEVKVQAATEENSSLRRAITELQDKSQTLHETTQAHR